MKEIRMFMFESCPHCAKARKIISSLLDTNPEYKNIPFVMIDEKLQPEEAELGNVRAEGRKLKYSGDHTFVS